MNYGEISNKKLQVRLGKWKHTFNICIGHADKLVRLSIISNGDARVSAVEQASYNV